MADPVPLALFHGAKRHGERIAIEDEFGRHTYAELLRASGRTAAGLLEGRPDLKGERVCFLVSRSFSYPAVQWGVWRAGGIAVPLGDSHPERELALVLDDTEPCAVVVDQAHEDRLRSLARERDVPLRRFEELVSTEDPRSGALPSISLDRRALIVYTSGTTGRPKGVVTTHANIEAQVESLRTAWGWQPDDHVLLVLPLHHVHGIVNVLTSALRSGAKCQMAPGFDALDTWNRIERGGLTLFMAVPTIYARLIAAWEDADDTQRDRWSRAAGGLRLMVSGSAALPVRTLERWREITGQTLLERYGMTEIGMGLSNPLFGDRLPGHVGQPLPGVQVRRVNRDGVPITDPLEPAELQIAGPGVFREYWRRPEETAAAFDGPWFRTGDVAVVDDGHYRLLGRASVDILKSGGFKVSALEVEEVIREIEGVRDCAVVGLPDEEWGERIAAAVVPEAGAELAVDALDSHARRCLARYKTPRAWLLVEALPRNAMGKVMKPRVAELFESGGAA